MAITETFERRQLVVDLGAHEAPSAWRWRGMQFLRYEDGSEAAPPRTVEVAADRADVEALLNVALAKQADDIAADARDRDALRTQLAKAQEALRAVAAADASWDNGVRNKVADALA